MYALIQTGSAVYGVGETVEAARADAAQWLEGGEEVAAQAKEFRSMDAVRYNTMGGELVIVPCTEALAAYVMENGGDVKLGEIDGVLCLESEEEAA